MNTIELAQTLHGYRDGHQLLASSTKLSREQEWQLLVMSDLSGPSFRAGFESYLTGYPLDAGGFYCLARTWFAPELPRPGCVWTHSILISDTDLARIGDFRSIIPYFRRPSSAKDLDSYDTSVHIDLSYDKPYILPAEVTSALLSLLYGSTSQTVVLTSSSSHSYEQLVLATFSQQWPRLRRNFRFCTGALAIRDVAFDVVIAPPNAVRQDTGGRDTVAVMPENTNLPTQQAAEGWIPVAVDDLMSGDVQAPLRRFLWKYGPDYAEGRKAFRPLCEIYLAASMSAESAEQTLSAVAHFFPDADSATRLKGEFFAAGGTLTRGSGGESLVLQTLVTHPGAGCIAEDTADIEQRARVLVSSDEEIAIRIAVAALNVGGPRAARYLNGFVAGVGSKPELLRGMSSRLKSELLDRQPALLAAPEIWAESSNEQLSLVAHIASLQNLSDLVSPICEAILAANAWPCMPTVLAKFGYPAVAAVLRWIDRIPQSTLSLPEPLLGALAAQQSVVTEVVRREALGKRALRVVSALLDPRADVVRALGTKVWAGLVGADVHLASISDEVRSKAFLLGIGLSVAAEGDVRLVREGFSAVYEGALTGSLDDEVWRFLQPYLPWYLVSWDRCARLTRGVVSLFLDRHWPPSEFVLTFAAGEQLARALDEADGTHKGTRFIKNLCKQIEIGALEVDDAHLEALKAYCARR